MYKVMIIDDEETIREGLRCVITGSSMIAVLLVRPKMAMKG